MTPANDNSNLAWDTTIGTLTFGPSQFEVGVSIIDGFFDLLGEIKDYDAAALLSIMHERTDIFLKERS